jgi:hypothetical protein
LNKGWWDVVSVRVRSFFVVAILLNVSISAVASIHAESDFSEIDNELEHGQKTWSYKAYQDSTMQWDRYRIFGNYGSRVILDGFTGLYWQHQAPLSAVSWSDQASPGSAQYYCDRLKQGGYRDWRVPSVLELQSLLDYTIFFGAMVNPIVFPFTVADFFWASANDIASPDYAWGVDFRGGSTQIRKSNSKGYLRCVRGSYPSVADRYVNENGSPLTPVSRQVKDLATGLIWQRGILSLTNQSAASKYCDSLLLGRTFWKLPTIKELGTLVNNKLFDPSLNETVFPGYSLESLWSSSRDSKSIGFWYQRFFVGETGVTPLEFPLFVRCVRR